MIITNAQKATLPIGSRIRCTTTVRLGLGETQTKVECYTVSGRRQAPKGLRLRLTSEFGYGVNDVNFEHPNCTWETLENEVSVE